MTRTIIRTILLGFGMVLLGCATTEPRQLSMTQQKTLIAEGYGRFDESLQVKQRWLSTRQIAKLNAYRGLADQLYDEPLGNGQTVGSRVIGNESYRIYLDNYLRGARASDFRTLQDSLKISLTLTLKPDFYQCMGGDDVEIKRCLREDHQIDYSRLGYRQAATAHVNLACSRRDCSDQFHVKGFSNTPNPVDDTLLNAGLYDAQWTANIGARMLFNQLLVNAFYNAL